MIGARDHQSADATLAQKEMFHTISLVQILALNP